MWIFSHTEKYRRSITVLSYMKIMGTFCRETKMMTVIKGFIFTVRRYNKRSQFEI